MNITRIIIKILLLTSIVGGGLYAVKRSNSINDLQLVKKLEEKKDQFQGSVKGITDSIFNQTQQLTTKGQEVGTHVNNVLENYIKPTEKNQSSENYSADEQKKPIYEETLDYGRYLYCQQVIKDYENQHP